ncbi:hypothetical protein C5167_002479 [Papaver somniferum]|uniref:Uncharacterized protein n=1 Tax=Papaver somniferum TaxID=3469 RepID=A0A4Y7KY88_PAPSO|nr:hypothetical protein C5167_002479 [Papaver somniferum]
MKMETTATSNGAPTPVFPSQTVETLVNARTTQTAPKLMVEMDVSDRLEGPDPQYFATCTGELVRTHYHVSYLDWRGVPKILKGIPLLRLKMNNPSALDARIWNSVRQRFRMWDMPARYIFYPDQSDLKMQNILMIGMT